MAEELMQMPPKEVKVWVVDMNLSPADFKDGVPSADLPSELQPSPGPSSMIVGSPMPPAGDAVGPPAAPPRVGAGGTGGVAAGRAAGQLPPPSNVPDLDAPSWTREYWCTPQLRTQIEAVEAAQGLDRDERSLLSGSDDSVTEAHGGTNETCRVVLDNGMVGYHKPFDGLNNRLAAGFGQDSAQQSVHEAAAWQLARQMGPPWSEMVPPCVIREAEGRLGSFALERPGRGGEYEPFNVPEWREAGFYDALIGQQDRHPENYLVAGDRLALIDHGYTFARPGDYMNYSWLAGKRHDADPVLSYNERQVLDRLLASKDLLGMESMLEPERAKALRARAERMRATGRITAPGEF
jgi:hypothetical protein